MGRQSLTPQPAFAIVARMTIIKLDLAGLKCPLPALRTSVGAMAGSAKAQFMANYNARWANVTLMATFPWWCWLTRPAKHGYPLPVKIG